MAYERQFQISNPALPRRVDDASMKQSHPASGAGPLPHGTCGGKVLPTAVIDTTGDTADMPGRGENLSPTRFRY